MATAPPPLYWPYPPEKVGTWPGDYPGHTGTDWPMPYGTPIPATSDSLVVFAGDDGLGGLTVDLIRSDGLVQRFGHMSQIWVRVGQRVAAGNTIGLVGSTGNSTGNHLHWELRWDRAWNGGSWVDPRNLTILNFGQEEDDMFTDDDRARMKRIESKINACYDAIFLRTATSQGYHAGLLAMLNAVYDSQFLEKETSRGTPGGTLTNDRISLENQADMIAKLFQIMAILGIPVEGGEEGDNDSKE